ncbi:DUF6176 family protein [Halorubellus litoreus]|uniref:DUF6176 family protein n=1 Tax=Halorubellus litoreus TaxID=755308 RepID=A0ABD5VAD7_9EURY
MANRRLFKLRLDPERLTEVREHFDGLEDRRETFERGLELEGMNGETAWLDAAEPALYYLHEESDEYPKDVDPDEMDEALAALSEDHHGFFETVAAPGHDHPEDLTEFERLFSVSARDQVE